MKLDIMADNVFMIETTIEAARSYFDGIEINEVLPDFDTTLDSAQGKAKELGSSYLVIRIAP